MESGGGVRGIPPVVVCVSKAPFAVRFVGCFFFFAASLFVVVVEVFLFFLAFYFAAPLNATDGWRRHKL